MLFQSFTIGYAFFVLQSKWIDNDDGLVYSLLGEKGTGVCNYKRIVRYNKEI